MANARFPVAKLLAWSVIVMSLLSLAVIGLLAGMMAGEASIQKELVATLRGQGAQVRFDWQTDNDEAGGSPPGPAILRQILGDDAFQRVAAVDLRRGTNTSLSTWKQVVALEGLTWLGASDAGIKNSYLTEMPEALTLETLILSGNPIGDPALEPLAKLPSLRRLDLADTSLTGGNLAALAKIESLRSLDLSGLPITDEAIPDLKRFKQLDELKLHETELTDQGLAQLLEALPDVQIDH